MPLNSAILHYTNSVDLHDGGVALAVRELATALSANCVPTKVYANRFGSAPLDPAVLINGACVTSKTQATFSIGRCSKRSLERCIDHSSILHIHGMWNRDSNVLAALASTRRIPIVLSPHGMLDRWSLRHKRWKKSIYLLLRPSFLKRRVDAVVCASEGEKDQIVERFPFLSERTHIIPPVLPATFQLFGENGNDTRGDRIKDEKTRVVLFLSRIHVVKGIEVLIDAFERLCRRHDDVELWIAGDGPRDYLETLKLRVRRHNIIDRVRWFGRVEGLRKRELFERANVFALPTQQENFGIVYVESLLAGCPIVTTNKSGVYRMLEQMGTTIVGPTPSEFELAIERVLYEPRSVPVGEELRRQVTQWLKPATLTHRYLSLYESLVRKAL